MLTIIYCSLSMIIRIGFDTFFIFNYTFFIKTLQFKNWLYCINVILSFYPLAAKQVNGTHVSKEELFKESDVVFLGVPLTNLTRNLVNMDRFKTMKNTSILVNTELAVVSSHTFSYLQYCSVLMKLLLLSTTIFLNVCDSSKNCAIMTCISTVFHINSG